MKVYNDITSFKKVPNAVVTSGTFDGVHAGHRKITDRLNEVARKNGGESIVISFWPHPRHVLSPDGAQLKLLATLEERITLLRQTGIDHLIILKFTREFAQLSSDDFIEKILINAIGTRKLVIGYDHKFGRNREGGFDYLKKNSGKFGFDIEEIPAQEVDDSVVSSSQIREALQAGDVATATSYLGYPYRITGTVVHGNKIGTTIGYPTANIEVAEPFKLIPGDGIYAVKVTHNGTTYGGMLSIGKRPTIKESDGKRTIEVNLFDVNRSLYDERLHIDFIAYIRPEEKFDTLDALKQKIAEDEQIAKNILNRSNTP